MRCYKYCHFVWPENNPSRSSNPASTTTPTSVSALQKAVSAVILQFFNFQLQNFCGYFLVINSQKCYRESTQVVTTTFSEGVGYITLHPGFQSVQWVLLTLIRQVSCYTLIIIATNSYMFIQSFRTTSPPVKTSFIPSLDYSHLQIQEKTHRNLLENF